MVLVLFDFDGTITKKDTLFEFIRFSCGTKKYLIGMVMLFPALVFHKFGFINNQFAKEKVLTYFFSGWSIEKFNISCINFCNSFLPKIIRHHALNKIEWHLQQSHTVLIVSASLENWIKPWAEKYHIQVVASVPEIKNSILTGKLLGMNCNGIEKVNRIRSIIDVDSYKTIIAYGDSKGDMPMLQLANEKHYKPFRS
jgi:phosphatidylglycerophosphatase C